MIRCTFENGNEALLRHVTMGGFCVHESRVLLIRRSEGLLDGGKIGPPGGYLERDETVEEGIVREVLEETGYQCSNPTLIAIKSDPSRSGAMRQDVELLFLLELGDGGKTRDGEASELLWVDLETPPTPDEFAFDHAENFQLLLDHLSQQNAQR